MPEQVGTRVDRVTSRAVAGNTALFTHGHVLRVLVARWIGHFLLNTGTLCVFGYYREIPAVRIGRALSSTKPRDGSNRSESWST
jgi:probable phosphoglycerate mutase